MNGPERVAPRRSCGTSERGSAAVLVTVLAGLLVTVAAASAVIGGLVVGQRRAAAAADLAALAGAEVLANVGGTGRGLPDGSACQQARAVAGANGARLTGCEVLGHEVLVSASVDVSGPLGQTWQVKTEARAVPAAGRISVPGDRAP
jgi:secretion/DNA translocation related TadE-like protein